MNAAGWAQHQSRAIIFTLAVLAVLGVISIARLPVLLFPKVSFPRVRISLSAGSRPAERMLVGVTRPVEQALRGIRDVQNIRSITSRGSADVDVDFAWGHDMVAATLEVNAAIGRIAASFPPGTSYDVRRMDPTVFPAIAYSITSQSHSLVDLRQLALYTLRPALSTVRGVAKVGVQGGAIEEWRVVVDPGKLQSFNLTLADVSAALSASNVLTAIGHLQRHDKLYLVVADTRFHTLAQLRSTIIRSGADGVVRLDDVAFVRPDTQPRYVRVTADGRDAVLFNVYQQPGSNTVQVARAIKAKLQQIAARVPSLKNGSVKIANWYDQSGLILASEGSVRDAIMFGVILAAIVIFAFLRSWKIMLIATLAVPTVLAVTLVVLSVMHMSLNIMTLGGMAAAVGLIIDDNIVMVEHIMRRMRTGEGEHQQRVTGATTEFTRPLAGSSGSTIIIFAPLALLSGVTGSFFKALSLTMAASLAISFLIAWLAVPVLAAHWLGEREAAPRQGGRWSTRMGDTYERGLARLLHRPWLVVLMVAPVLLAGWLAFGHVASGFMPSMDEGGFILDYVAPPGTSLTETDRELRQVEAILNATPAVETYSRRTGLQLGGGVTEANQGDFFVRLKPFPRPPIDRVMSAVRAQIAHSIPSLKVETSQLMEDLIGDLTGVPQPVDIKLFSPDESTLLKVAPRVAQAIGKVRGVVEVKSGIVIAGDSLDVEVNRVEASLEGVNPQAVTRALAGYISGAVATSVRRGPRLVGVRVWVPHDLIASQRDLDELPLRAPDGHLFPLERVATLKVITGQPQIDRENLMRMVGVTARISGRDLGSTMIAVKRVLSRKGLLPHGMSYQLGGTYHQQQQSFHGLERVIVAALVLVVILLLFLYRRFLVALAMLVIIFLEICWILLALWLTGTELDIMSIMGMTMIIGIVTETSIFYYSEYLVLTDGDGRARLVMAGAHRARAVAMTTIAAVFALITLALGIGQGAALLQPLAIAI
ncbi:MAG TPA: efflux RND transporter permease subunit, partial [Steroidobacteraceae bacterium]|nr:efflux RND transporter permease subunit [Steroidobacteraceae bacterium]